MFEAIKGVFGSKTMWVTILGSVAYIVLVQGFGVPDEFAVKVLGLFGLKIGQQALADYGKEAAKVEAALAEKTAGLSPADKARALVDEALGDDAAAE